MSVPFWRANSWRAKSAIFLTVVACALAGCAGKDAAPIDVEKQAFEDLRSKIRQAIDDPAREAEAISLLNALTEDLDGLREKMSERKQRVRRINADYDARRADFEELFEQIDGDIMANRKRVTENHRALLAATTPEEWSSILKARTQAMNAVRKSFQAI